MNNSSKSSIHETAFRKFRLIVRILTLSAFLFILFLPAVLMLFGTAGETPYKKPSADDFFSGNFQEKTEEWLLHSLPFGNDIRILNSRFISDFTSPPAPSDSESAAANSESEISESGTEEPAILWNDSNPLYAEINKIRAFRTMTEPSGYKGAPTVIIGKSGYLYENGYINEYLGYSEIYREVTKERIKKQVLMLEYISERLKENGCAFVFVLTPSKASQYPEAIPEWYKKQNKTPDGYTRPYELLIKELAGSGVPYIDSTALYAEIGLEETFPKTGTHWNKPAAFETTRAILLEYERQTGREIRRLAADRLLSSKNPPGFGNPEQDILGFVINGIKRSDLILDDDYYWPDAYVENEDCKNRPNFFIQGGSFAHDFTTYFSSFNIASKMTRMYYNGFPSDALNAFADPSRWEKLLKNIDYVIFECNEQFVRSLGGNSPDWSSDKRGYEIGPDCYDSLYNYLKSTEQ